MLDLGEQQVYFEKKKIKSSKVDFEFKKCNVKHNFIKWFNFPLHISYFSNIVNFQIPVQWLQGKVCANFVWCKNWPISAAWRVMSSIGPIREIIMCGKDNTVRLWGSTKASSLNNNVVFLFLKAWYAQMLVSVLIKNIKCVLFFPPLRHWEVQ